MPDPQGIVGRIYGAVGNALGSAVSEVGGLASKASQIASNFGSAANQEFNYLTGVPALRAYTNNQQTAAQPSLPPVHGYRADPTGRFGGGNGLETLPTTFDSNKLYGMTSALAQAQKFGVPQLSATELAALALKEGRGDYGAGVYDFNNPSSVALMKGLQKDGVDEFSALFPTIVAEKMQESKRLGIPFAEAWNGTGSNGQSTGAQYAQGYQSALKAAQDPKNAQLVAFIQNALNSGQRK